MAGGVWNTPNSSYYLYNGQYYWTLSPFYFAASYSLSSVLYLSTTGGLLSGNRVDVSYNARPVINLRLDVRITKGDGTALNPYVVQS